MGGFTARMGWRVAAGAALAMAALAVMSASPSLARRRHDTVTIHSILHARRIGHVGFGTRPTRLIQTLDRMLRHRPTERRQVVHACGIDHAIGWPGLVVFISRGRVVGYSYRPAYASPGVPILATARGLLVGDTLATGRRLYGQDFHSSRRYGGSWWASTPDGRLEGLASGWPHGPVGSVATIAAGDVGCPAATP